MQQARTFGLISKFRRRLRTQISLIFPRTVLGGGLLIRRFGMISDDLGWSFQDLIDVLFLKKTRWVWSHFWSLHRMAAEQKTCLLCYSRIALLQRLCYKALRSRFTSKVANWCKLQIWQCGASPPCCKRSPARGRAWKHILYTFCPQDLASSFGLQVCCEQAVSPQLTSKVFECNGLRIVPALIPLDFLDLKDYAGTTEQLLASPTAGELPLSECNGMLTPSFM